MVGYRESQRISTSWLRQKLLSGYSLSCGKPRRQPIVWALLHECTENHLGMDSAFSAKWQQTRVFGGSLFPLCSWIRTMRNLLSDIWYILPRIYLRLLFVCCCCFVFWQRQTRDTEHSEQRLRKKKEKEFQIICLCGASAGLLRGPATLSTEQKTSEIISLVTKC